MITSCRGNGDELAASPCAAPFGIALNISTDEHARVRPSMSVSKVPFPVPLSNTRFLRPSINPYPTRHLDRFSRFSRAHDRDQQTDTHTETDNAILSVVIGRILMLCMRCSLTVYIIITS